MTPTTLLQRLLHPEELGHAVSAEVRQLARAELERWSYRPDRIYIAGPMTGLPDYNYPAFHAAAAELRAAGYEVVNPAENGLRPDTPWEAHMRRYDPRAGRWCTQRVAGPVDDQPTFDLS